tara:strand:- start:9548 stop:10012 length:465 start_codon:yes stop_codon:yes gene_type:complete
MRHQTNLIVLLAVFWLANSGHFTTLALGLGAISVFVVVFFARRMNVIDHEAQPLYLLPNIIYYWGWLGKEIVLANIDVTKRIWLGASSINSSIVVLESSPHSDIGKVILANSITLTPGTITLNLNGDEVTVHALSDHSVSGLATIDRRVSRIES